VKDGRPLFLMEDELGFKREASADEIARAFSGRWPRLVFLSGCKTGLAVDEGWLPSLCEAVVLAGAPAVLGWALPVGDAAATAAATTLYRELALGKRADEAVARARQKLLEDQSPYWHLLRLYASATPLDEHVTPLGTVGRERLRTREAATEFWDAGAKGEVCARNVFVGRRRPMQRCLRVLKSAQGEPDYAEGILLHGTGGLGKSSLAARLCERMPGHRRLVWSGRVDEMEFVKVVGDRLNSAEAIRILNDPGLALKQRLRLLLLGPLAEQSTLLVLDDFEHNLDLTSNGTAIVQAPALEVLTALLAAVRDTASDSRVIVTSRYTFPLSGPAHLYWEGLESMRGAELEKKAALLPTLQRMEHADKGLRERAITLAAGNPRLLERLDRVLADVMTDHDAMFSAMASKAEEFREEMLLRELLRQQSPACRRLLALLSTGGLPMERATAQAIAAGDALEPYLGRAVSVGLVESGKDPASKQPRYYVSGMVSPLVAQEISDQERVAACGRGARHFYQTLRLGTQAGSVEQLLETHRLACLGGEKDIAVEISDAVATAWVKRARYREAEALSRVTLSLGDDYRLLHNLARAEEVLGKTEDARRHYEQALAQCPGLAAVASPQVARERGAILSNLAGLLALQGQVQRALELWNQSLALKEQIGDVKGKAATLSMMARVIAQQGDVTRALELWNQSLVILE
jgi:tetratricopeptide (TPR) repeat protein